MKKALLVVSFGTSHAETRKKTIEAIEAELRSAFPDRAFYRAWTSAFLRKKLREQNLQIDAVPEALDRLRRDGVTDLLVQPTHMTLGAEFQKAVEAVVSSEKSGFDRVALGAPLLADREDVHALAHALEDIFQTEVGGDTMLALMGHGSAELSPNPYLLLDADLKADGFERFCVGTVEHSPGFAPVPERARLLRPAKIVLSPLMVVAGDHALNDMAGDNGDSWKQRLRTEGFQTAAILRGLGEYPQVRELYVNHAQRAKVL